MGKSQMLQAIASVAPRGVYVCGNATTTAGLTVSLHKDSSGDYALEAGALILGDQGCCCIDEFDKMGADHQALLEGFFLCFLLFVLCSLFFVLCSLFFDVIGKNVRASMNFCLIAMEQQSVSIAKAGICCSLPARTSVLAAANPVGGHYKFLISLLFLLLFFLFFAALAQCEALGSSLLFLGFSKAKTVSENLKMGSALLSRFDLIFILMDKPDQDMDQFLSEHVMAVCLFLFSLLLLFACLFACLLVLFLVLILR